MSETDDSKRLTAESTREQDSYRLLVHVVAPIGTAIWAFTQAPGGEPWTAWALLLLSAVSLFYGSNRLLKIADERLNPSAQKVINS